MNNIIKEMLLIEGPSVFKLYQEMSKISGYFVAPLFLLSLVVEFLGNLDFAAVIKRLLIVLLVLSSFYGIHKKAVEISLAASSKTLRKVSRDNLFVKKWYERKIKTKKKKGWGYLESIAIPNLNDLLATTFFLLAKVFTWLLKLIYSCVYHLTYVFSGITALLYFFGWANKALVGTIQSTLWCIILPFVVVSILALVGNSIGEQAIKGDLAIAEIETILWLFGVTLILLLSPLITWSMVKGEGIAAAGSKIGAMAVSAGVKAPYLYSLAYSKGSNFVRNVRYRTANAKRLLTKGEKGSGYSLNYSKHHKYGYRNGASSKKYNSKWNNSGSERHQRAAERTYRDNDRSSYWGENSYRSEKRDQERPRGRSDAYSYSQRPPGERKLASHKSLTRVLRKSKHRSKSHETKNRPLRNKLSSLIKRSPNKRRKKL